MVCLMMQPSQNGLGVQWQRSFGGHQQNTEVRLLQSWYHFSLTWPLNFIQRWICLQALQSWGLRYCRCYRGMLPRGTFEVWWPRHMVAYIFQVEGASSWNYDPANCAQDNWGHDSSRIWMGHFCCSRPRCLLPRRAMGNQGFSAGSRVAGARPICVVGAGSLCRYPTFCPLSVFCPEFDHLLSTFCPYFVLILSLSCLWLHYVHKIPASVHP